MLTGRPLRHVQARRAGLPSMNPGRFDVDNLRIWDPETVNPDLCPVSRFEIYLEYRLAQGGIIRTGAHRIDRRRKLGGLTGWRENNSCDHHSDRQSAENYVDEPVTHIVECMKAAAV